MAATERNREMVEYRAVLVQPGSLLVLALDIAGCHCLPRVTIPQWTRPAQELRRAIEATWGLDAFILEIVMGPDGSAPCFVAELSTPRINFPLEEVTLDQIADLEFSHDERSQLKLLLGDKSSSPLSRVGWVHLAAMWLESVTQRTFSNRKSMEQLNAGGGFALLRFRSDDGRDYWLKATGEPNTHEISVTFLLSKLCSPYLPEFIASHPEWNAWIMSGEGMGIAEFAAEPSLLSDLLEDAVSSMAKLQCSTAGRESDFLDSGAFDQRVEVLAKHSGELFEYIEEAMSLQVSTRVAPIERRRIQELKRIFEGAVWRMNTLGLPNTVVHGDIDLANIVIRNGRCQFIDWCETYIGNPLVTLQHLLLLNRAETTEQKASIDRVLKDRYRKEMSKFCEPAAIDEGFLLMPLLAAYSSLYGRGDWFMTPQHDDPRRLAFARTIARHMDRAARSPDLLAAV